MGSAFRQTACQAFIDAFGEYFNRSTWLAYNDLYEAVFEYSVVIVDGEDKEFMDTEPLFDGEFGLSGYDSDGLEKFVFKMATKCRLAESVVWVILYKNGFIYSVQKRVY